MAGQVCLVTGASRGIGKGIATMLSKAGATVYVTGSRYELYAVITLWGRLFLAGLALTLR